MVGRPYRYQTAWRAPQRHPYHPKRGLFGLGTNGNANGNGEEVDTTQFTRGSVFGRGGVIIGAGISALIGRWAGGRWGKTPESPGNWAMAAAGLSLATSLFKNKRSTGYYFPSGEVVRKHMEWVEGGGGVERIVLPGATAGPVPMPAPAPANGQTALAILKALREDPLMAQVMGYFGAPSAEHVSRMKELKAKMEAAIESAKVAAKPGAEQVELDQAMAAIQGMIDMFNQSIPQMEAQLTGWY